MTKYISKNTCDLKHFTNINTMYRLVGREKLFYEEGKIIR